MEIISIQSVKGRFKQQVVEVSLEKMNRLTVLNSQTLKNQLINIINDSHTKLVVNMRTIRFMDSSGFDCLNLVSRLAKRNHSEVVLKEVHPDLMELIVLVKMHSVFDIRQVDVVSQQSNVA